MHAGRAGAPRGRLGPLPRTRRVPGHADGSESPAGSLARDQSRREAASSKLEPPPPPPEPESPRYRAGQRAGPQVPRAEDPPPGVRRDAGREGGGPGADAERGAGGEDGALWAGWWWAGWWWGVIGPDRCGAAVRGALRWLRPRPAAAASAGAQTRPGPDWGVSPEGG